MPRAAFMTLGCKVNYFDTEAMTGMFRSAGYEIVPFDAESDVYIINTCSVTSLGEKKSRALIRRAKKRNPDALVVATGCYAQLSPDEIEKIGGVGLVIGTNERAKIVELVRQAADEKTALNTVGDVLRVHEFEDIPLNHPAGRTRAFLKIEDGCENFCSYCVIPYARGPVRSRPLESIRREAENLARAGFHEVVLTGIHLGAYGKDIGLSLADAVRETLKISELSRLRLSSIESVEISEELLRIFSGDPRLAPHLHLPVQSGCDATLSRMNRHYNAEDFSRMIENVRSTVPGIAISTDIIVGFPGETAEDFEASLRFAERIGFSRMHVFPYSARRGTPAAKMPGQIPSAEKKSRAARMQRTADEMSETYRKSFIGKKVDALFETKKGGLFSGFSGHYVRVYTDAEVKTGIITKARVLKTCADGLLVEPS